MNIISPFRYLQMIIAGLLCTFIVSCSTSSKMVEHDQFRSSGVNPETLISKMPNYTSSLSTLKGKGKAIVSEPGHTERVTLHFFSNRKKSLVKVSNSLGIEGGQLLTDGDTLLVYNKVDKLARKIPVWGGDLSSINNLASLNILTMINFTITPGQILNISEDPGSYLLLLKSGAKIFVDKKQFTVQEVWQPHSSGLPYSKIRYGGYGQLQGFLLPRRMTIFSSDEQSKIDLLIRNLEANPGLEPLSIELPDNITIYKQ